MRSYYDNIVQLTAGNLSATERSSRLKDFARDLGWRPSDQIEAPTVDNVASAHLLVEHGLEHTAVITFLKHGRRYADLGIEDKHRLLSVSYNNLVDWHIPVEAESVRYVYVRSRVLSVVEHHPLSRDRVDELRSERFEQVVGRKPNPNVPTLDDALIRTISWWKRSLAADLSGSLVSNVHYSALFNSLIFVRALEDNQRRTKAVSGSLLRQWRDRGRGETYRSVLVMYVGQLNAGPVSSRIFDERLLAPFDALHGDTVERMLRDFYENRFAPYDYDFSIMSKHALSKIYERYVSVLRHEEPIQLSFFPELPAEVNDKSFGAVYTPQFIARFFAHFVSEEVPPKAFRRMQVLDPACGSGIFLRAFLEKQCDRVYESMTREAVDAAFRSVAGWDIDENAVHATYLSLALLYLALEDSLPGDLNVVQVDATTRSARVLASSASLDVVVANPPYVAADTQDEVTRQRIAAYMTGLATGRIDLYLVFLKYAIDLLKPGGFALFVLPHSFLLSDNAAGVREALAGQFWVRCLADLSAVEVFEGTGVYVVLLILQRREAGAIAAPNAVVVRCTDQPAKALQEVLDNFRGSTAYSSVYEVPQSTFEQKKWLVLPPGEASLRSRLRNHCRLEEFLYVRQGFVTGADNVFIIPSEHVPEGEAAVYRPFLADREMRPFAVPKRVKESVFYPYIGRKKVDEKMLQREFPKTWEYLEGHRKELESRRSLKDGSLAWWMPIRPRSPENMMRSKIVTPHLVITPRFSLDRAGTYAVSRSPLLYPRDASAPDDLLVYFVAVLNSSACFWAISNGSHKYRHGYAMLEVKTLQDVPVPDPVKLSAADLRKFLGLVNSRLDADSAKVATLDREIDLVVSDLYGLTRADRASLGIED